MIGAYSNLASFYVMALMALPAVILGLAQRPIRRYALVASVVGVVLLMSGTPAELGWLAVFLVYEFAIILGWARFRAARPGIHRYVARGVAAGATLPLVVVKVSALFPTMSIGFLGASYLSFRVIQVVLEITDGLITEVNAWDLAGFVLFFPTLTSGPIDRSRRFDQDSHRVWTRTEYGWLLGRGLSLLLLGAVYKFVFATWFAARLAWATGHHAWAYMYIYSGDLFFDFAGYSAMAVGLSYLFGVRTPMNFRYPFAAESIKDFWNRWHITLSFWLRDYLYSRLSMFLLRKKVFRSRVVAGRVALLANMVIMGLWHGFAAHYILYGLYHGLLLVGNDVYEKKSRFYSRFHKRWWYRVAAIAVTAQLVILGFWLFSGRILSW